MRGRSGTAHRESHGGGKKENTAKLCNVSSHLQTLKSHLPFGGIFANKSTEIHHLDKIRQVSNFKMCASFFKN